jgi:hypothetical protein
MLTALLNKAAGIIDINNANILRAVYKYNDNSFSDLADLTEWYTPFLKEYKLIIVTEKGLNFV